MEGGRSFPSRPLGQEKTRAEAMAADLNLKISHVRQDAADTRHRFYSGLGVCSKEVFLALGPIPFESYQNRLLPRRGGNNI